jgi:hypothetical protein
LYSLLIQYFTWYIYVHMSYTHFRSLVLTRERKSVQRIQFTMSFVWKWAESTIYLWFLLYTKQLMGHLNTFFVFLQFLEWRTPLFNFFFYYKLENKTFKIVFKLNTSLISFSDWKNSLSTLYLLYSIFYNKTIFVKIYYDPLINLAIKIKNGEYYDPLV